EHGAGHLRAQGFGDGVHGVFTTAKGTAPSALSTVADRLFRPPVVYKKPLVGFQQLSSELK
ncbi:hypothetical protein, partial [Streptosporangium fragile]|uniref:hypothetical protein n=1 Tax=Streptosporangium fragile TaxID=46186 RepID=UPI0031E67319